MSFGAPEQLIPNAVEPEPQPEPAPEPTPEAPAAPEPAPAPAPEPEPAPAVDPEAAPPVDRSDPEALQEQLNKPQLQDVAADEGVAKSGTKQEIAERIADAQEQPYERWQRQGYVD